MRNSNCLSRLLVLGFIGLSICSSAAQTNKPNGKGLEEDIRATTNWIQRLSPPPPKIAIEAASLLMPEERAPSWVNIDSEFLDMFRESLIQPGLPLGFRHGNLRAEGYCQTPGGRLLLWQMKGKSEVVFDDMNGATWSAQVTSPLMISNFSMPRTKRGSPWPSVSEINSFVMHPRWPPEGLSTIRERVFSIMRAGRRHEVASYEEHLSWKTNQVARFALNVIKENDGPPKVSLLGPGGTPYLGNRTTYFDGILLTQQDEMLAWELLVRRHVVLQDKEGRILQIEGEDVALLKGIEGVRDE